MTQEAADRHFREHHACLLTKMLARIDAIQAEIDDDAQIEVYIAPFAQAAARLEQIPGSGRVLRGTAAARLVTVVSY